MIKKCKFTKNGQCMFVISDHTLVKCEGEAEDRGCCPFWRKR